MGDEPSRADKKSQFVVSASEVAKRARKVSDTPRKAAQETKRRAKDTSHVPPAPKRALPTTPTCSSRSQAHSSRSSASAADDKIRRRSKKTDLRIDFAYWARTGSREAEMKEKRARFTNRWAKINRNISAPAPADPGQSSADPGQSLSLKRYVDDQAHKYKIAKLLPRWLGMPVQPRKEHVNNWAATM